MDTKTENNLIHIEHIKVGDLLLLSSHTYKNYSNEVKSTCTYCNRCYIGLVKNIKKEYEKGSIEYFTFNVVCIYCKKEDEFWYYHKNKYPAKLIRYIKI